VNPICWLFSLGLWYATNGNNHQGPFYTKQGAMNEASLWNEMLMGEGLQPVWYAETRKRLK
jgi:hypothetical protein